MHDLTCATCGNSVLVEKFSPVHTSVQWTGDSSDCPEFAQHLARGESVQSIPTCTQLRASIDRAVREGDLRTDDVRREPIPGRIR